MSSPSQMTAPKTAAVRFCMCNWDDKRKPEPEEIEAYREEFRTSSEILADHIRAVCAEMRERAVQAEAATSAVSAIGAEMLHNYANDLRVFADRLEGREP